VPEESDSETDSGLRRVVGVVKEGRAVDVEVPAGLSYRARRSGSGCVAFPWLRREKVGCIGLGALAKSRRLDGEGWWAAIVLLCRSWRW
jgi:hypothetical protein